MLLKDLGLKVPDKEKLQEADASLSKSIQDKLLKEIKSDPFLEPNMMEVVRKAQNILKQIDTVNTRFDIECEKYKKASKPDLWQTEVSYYFYFFVTMLGFIDARIEDAKRSIEFEDNFTDPLFPDNERHKEAIREHEDFILEASLDREEIVNAYENINNKYNPYSNLFLGVIRTQPSYEQFNLLYQNSRVDNNSRSMQQQLVNAYNIGYIDFYGSYDEKINEYKTLLSDLIKHIEDNLGKLSEAKGIQKKKN